MSLPSKSRCVLLLTLCALGSCVLLEKVALDLGKHLFESDGRTGTLVDGKHEGLWNFRYEGGAPMAKGNYVNDKQVGRWIYWFENGNVEWQGGFAERLSGPTFFGYDNGNKRAIGSFEDGLEEDLWTFWDSSGDLRCEGDFMRGSPALRWTYFHSNGSPSAEGYRLHGERVGPWRFYDEAGELSERRFPMPEGLEIVQDLWGGAAPRREGFLVDGMQSGRWATMHPNGRRRLTVDFVDGEPHGLLLAWTDKGQPVARGRFERGVPTGDWEVWRGGATEQVAASGLNLDLEFSGTWSKQGNPGARTPERAVALWMAELRSEPITPLSAEPDPSIPSPPSELVAASESVPSVPLRPQPWTVSELGALEFLVARYTDEATAVRPRGGVYSRPSAQNRSGGGGDPTLSPQFIGTELPWTRFHSAEGEVVDMDDFRSRSKVVLVVLRGFSKDVCVYCVTQTTALCNSIEEFQKRGCEVFVVYPGEKNRLEAFMESFELFSGIQGKPPIGVLYDRNMELVERMGITSEFAIPSTFVLDESGVIRYSYVGENIEDRPPTKKVLEAISGMSAQ